MSICIHNILRDRTASHIPTLGPKKIYTATVCGPFGRARSPCKSRYVYGFSQNYEYLLGVPIIRTMIFSGLCWKGGAAMQLYHATFMK